MNALALFDEYNSDFGRHAVRQLPNLQTHFFEFNQELPLHNGRVQNLELNNTAYNIQLTETGDHFLIIDDTDFVGTASFLCEIPAGTSVAVIVRAQSPKARTIWNITLNGAGAEIVWLNLMEGEAGYNESTVFVRHQSPNTHSYILARGAIWGQMHGVCQVLTTMAAGCSASSAVQNIRCLLLDKQARYDGRPELNIEHDQVTAKHGCSVGGLDEDQLFYLSQRGIGRESATRLLRSAFMQNISELPPRFRPFVDNYWTGA